MKWNIQAILIFKAFKAEAPFCDKILHILVNTIVTIPFRDLEDERQRSKATEIFWNMVVNSTAYSTVIFCSGLFTDSDLYVDYGNCLALSPLPILLNLLSGLFLHLYYRKVHHWREVFDTKIDSRCFSTKG